MEKETNSTVLVTSYYQMNRRILCMPKPSQKGSPLVSAHHTQYFRDEQILPLLSAQLRKVTLFATPYLNIWGFLLPPLASKE